MVDAGNIDRGKESDEMTVVGESDTVITPTSVHCIIKSTERRSARLEGRSDEESRSKEKKGKGNHQLLTQGPERPSDH